MPHTTPSSPTPLKGAPPPSSLGSTQDPTTAASPHRRRRHWIITGILLILAVIFEFNPLHPIVWWQHTKDDVRQGWEAGGRDKAEATARTLRETQQGAQRHPPSPTATPSP